MQSYTDSIIHRIEKALYTSLMITSSGLKISITHSSISDNKDIQKISFRNPDLQYRRLQNLALRTITAHKQR